MFAGIDISKNKFDVCLSNDETTKRSKVFQNNQAGFEKMLEWIKQHLSKRNKNFSGSKQTDVWFCMEATGAYHLALAEFLHNAQEKVSVANPFCVNRFKQAMAVNQKTDKSDAFVIAKYCEKCSPSLFIPKPSHVKDLGELYSLQEDLIKEKIAWSNKLEKEHFNPKAKKMILEEIQHCKDRIKELSEEIDRFIQSHDDLKKQFQTLTSIKGVGPKLAVAILVGMPDVNQFDNAQQYAAFVGLAPSHYQSGSSVNGRSHISRKGSSLLRKKAYMAALVIKQSNEYFAKWIQKLEKKGKAAKVIIIAIARKLFSVIYGMLKTDSEFNPQLAFKN